MQVQEFDSIWGVPKISRRTQSKGHNFTMVLLAMVKGLCDTMSSFGVKAPLLKAVITDDFKYNSAKDICDLMQNLFINDAQKGPLPHQS